MPGFDCVVPMIDSNVHIFLILSLALLKTYFSGGNPGKASCCKGFVLSQPVSQLTGTNHIPCKTRWNTRESIMCAEPAGSRF